MKDTAHGGKVEITRFGVGHLNKNLNKLIWRYAQSKAGLNVEGWTSNLDCKVERGARILGN